MICVIALLTIGLIAGVFVVIVVVQSITGKVVETIIDVVFRGKGR